MKYSQLRSEYSSDELDAIFASQDREVCDLVASLIRACQREVATGTSFSEQFRFEVGGSLARHLDVEGQVSNQFATYIADLLEQPLVN